MEKQYFCRRQPEVGEREIRTCRYRVGSPGKLPSELFYEKRRKNVVRQVGRDQELLAGDYSQINKNKLPNTESRSSGCENLVTCHTIIDTSFEFEESSDIQAVKAPLTEWFESHKPQPHSFHALNSLPLPLEMKSKNETTILRSRGRTRHRVLQVKRQRTHVMIKAVNVLRKEEVASFPEKQSERKPWLGYPRVAM